MSALIDAVLADLLHLDVRFSPGQIGIAVAAKKLTYLASCIVAQVTVCTVRITIPVFPYSPVSTVKLCVYRVCSLISTLIYVF